MHAPLVRRYRSLYWQRHKWDNWPNWPLVTNLVLMFCRKLLNLWNRTLEASTSLCTHLPMGQRCCVRQFILLGFSFKILRHLISVFFLQVSKPLLETSRNGYLAAISASSYSFVSLLKHFVPIMNPGTFLT